MRDEAYDRLRAAILNGAHVPGDWLREEDISRQLGISRMPVREALRRLENEGFLEHFPNRGSQVTEIFSEDLPDIYDVRIFVEGRAAKLAAMRKTPEQLSRMRQNLTDFSNSEGEDLARLANEFTELIMEASGSKFLRQIGRNITDMVVRIRYHTHGIPSRKEDTLREHTLIYDALRKGDANLAEATVVAHLSSAKSRTLLRARESGLSESVRTQKDNKN